MYHIWREEETDIDSDYYVSKFGFTIKNMRSDEDKLCKIMKMITKGNALFGHTHVKLILEVETCDL